MIKKLKTKKMISLLLVFLLYINSFMSYATSNDGSSFITKAEFDLLKNAFQSQLDEYNKGIDSKIESAISAYLKGVTLSHESEDIYTLIVNSIGSNPVWLQRIATGADSISSYDMSGTAYIFGKLCNNMYCYMGYGGSVPDTQLQIAQTTHTQGSYSRDFNWYYWYGVRGTVKANLHTVALTKSSYYNATKWPATYDITTWTQTLTDSVSGSGSRWTSQKFGDFECLKNFNTSYYVANNIQAFEYYYFYKQLNEADKAAYLSDAGKSITTSLPAYTIMPQAGQTVTVGTRSTISSPSNDAYVEYNSYLRKINDGQNYLNTFWSLDSVSPIYVYDEEYQGENNTTTSTYTIPAGEFKDVYYMANGANIQKNTYPAYSFNYYDLYLKNSSVKTNASSYCNYASSKVIGEKVFNGGGMPIVKTFDDDKRIKVELKLSAASNDTVEIKFSDKQFLVGAFDSTAKLAYSGTVVANASDYTSFEFVVPNPGYVWLYLKNASGDNAITISDLKFTDMN